MIPSLQLGDGIFKNKLEETSNGRRKRKKQADRIRHRSKIKRIERELPEKSQEFDLRRATKRFHHNDRTSPKK